MRKRYTATAAILTLLLLASCGTMQSGESSGQSYSEVKSMVIDILKSEDATKALQEGSSGSSSSGSSGIKLFSTQEGTQIKDTIKGVMTSSEGSKLLQETFTDPKFASDFAKALQDENKTIQKDLIKDPDYQKSLLQLMHDPEYTKVVENVLKGQQFRLTMMDVMRESLQNPIFKAEMIQMMGKAIEQQTKEKSAEELKAKGAEKKSGEGEKSSSESESKGGGTGS